jgi:hypothetical protein
VHNKSIEKGRKTQQSQKGAKNMAALTIELSEYVIDAIADAVVKKMQKPCACEYYDAENETCRRSEVPSEEEAKE